MYPISMVILVFSSENCGYSAFPSMDFQVFGLVMGWHLIGQWQCRAESLDLIGPGYRSETAVASKVRMPRYGSGIVCQGKRWKWPSWKFRVVLV